MKEAVIASSVRTAVGKAYKGALHATRPDDLAAIAITPPFSASPALIPRRSRTSSWAAPCPKANRA